MTESTEDTQEVTIKITGEDKPKKAIPWKQILIALGIAATLLRSG